MYFISFSTDLSLFLIPFLCFFGVCFVSLFQVQDFVFLLGIMGDLLKVIDLTIHIHIHLQLESICGGAGDEEASSWPPLHHLTHIS